MRRHLFTILSGVSLLLCARDQSMMRRLVRLPVAPSLFRTLAFAQGGAFT